MRARPLPPWLSLLAVLLLAGCATMDEGRRERVYAEAAAAGLVRQTLDAGIFELAIWHRGLAGASTISVYVEGDGRAWRTRRTLSDDPTPGNPVSLALAARDPTAAVLYVARPCQFGTVATDADCDPRYWSSHRYAPEVVEALSAVLDWARERSGSGERLRFGLSGFSGGGALAALLAERRRDVAWLATVAANLDLEAWTAHHSLSPLAGSLDPATDAARLRGLPQLHLVGERDDVVPAVTRERFLARAGVGQQAVPGNGHGCCWSGDWRERLCGLLATVPGIETPAGCR